METKENRLHWYPMRIAYGRAERMKRFQQMLNEEKIQNFMVWRDEFERTDDWKVKKDRQPAIDGLIFVRSSQSAITQLKMTRPEFAPMRYYTNRISDSLSGAPLNKILVIPDRQMDNFMNIYNQRDEKVALLEYTDFILKPGKRVRVKEGIFANAVGTVKRIKKTQCVVVQIEGFAAMALTFVPPSWLEEITEEDYRQFMAKDTQDDKSEVQETN